MVRPSARCTMMRSSVTSTVRIRGSLLATMVIPCLQDVLQVLQNNASDTIRFSSRGESHDLCLTRLTPAKTYISSARDVRGHAGVRDHQSCRRISDRSLGYWEPWA